MPAQPQWLLHLPRILTELAALQSPVVDRAAIERLFGVRRRRAIGLMSRFGGYQVGRTFVVERQQLIAALEAMRAGDRFEYERRRKTRVIADLEQARRHSAAVQVVIPLEPHDREMTPDQLPPDVRLEAGRLTVCFAGTEDLLRKLYGLAQAAANDFEAFQSAAEARGAAEQKGRAGRA
jgi:hypothetical protein